MGSWWSYYIGSKFDLVLNQLSPVYALKSYWCHMFVFRSYIPVGLTLGLWGASLEVLYLWSPLFEHFAIHSGWYPNICCRNLKSAYIFMRIKKIRSVVNYSLLMTNGTRLKRESGEVCTSRLWASLLACSHNVSTHAQFLWHTLYVSDSPDLLTELRLSS
jgi:hypothetical protein